VVCAFSICAASLIIKPFTASDVHERVSEYYHEKAIRKETHTLECNGIMMNYRTGLVNVDGKLVKLTGKATALLRVLLENKNKVVSRDYLLKNIWGEGFCGRDRVVDSQIRTLRKLLGVKGKLIRTEKGAGYMIGGKQ
jgi:DNA-binding response OmpR family regulator